MKTLLYSVGQQVLDWLVCKGVVCVFGTLVYFHISLQKSQCLGQVVNFVIPSRNWRSNSTKTYTDVTLT